MNWLLVKFSHELFKWAIIITAIINLMTGFSNRSWALDQLLTHVRFNASVWLSSSCLVWLSSSSLFFLSPSHLLFPKIVLRWMAVERLLARETWSYRLQFLFLTVFYTVFQRSCFFFDCVLHRVICDPVCVDMLRMVLQHMFSNVSILHCSSAGNFQDSPILQYHLMVWIKNAGIFTHISRWVY